MIKQIDKDNKIFQSEEYLKDKYKFNIILKNLASPTLELYSDEESYVICRGKKGLPTWIWTRDNLDQAKIEEIEKLINMYLTDADKDKFTCKKELYDLLAVRGFKNLNPDDYFEMGFLICHHTKKPKESDGFISVPHEEDRQTLEKYWYDDTREMNGSDPITMEQAQNDVEEFLKSGRFFVFRNQDGKIVSMAYYSLSEEQAKIGHVYTPPEERGKGYAANLIYEMTNELLNRGYVPLLYTDYNYIASNKAYQNAGYEDGGILINFSCTRILEKDVGER